jgi:hypothetical protein
LNEVGRLLSDLSQIVAQGRPRQDALRARMVLLTRVDGDLERVAMPIDFYAVPGEACASQSLSRGSRGLEGGERH